MPTAMPLEDLLEHLHSPDGRTRERAIRRLLHRGRTGFTPEQGVLVLKASSLPYPPRRDRADDTAVDLVRAALNVPYPEYLPHVVERYHRWTPRARAEALRLLMRIEDRRAAEAVMNIVRRHARAGNVQRLPAGLYAHAPQHAEVFFPELLDYLDVTRNCIFDLCAWHCRSRLDTSSKPGRTAAGGRLRSWPSTPRSAVDSCRAQRLRRSRLALAAAISPPPLAGRNSTGLTGAHADAGRRSRDAEGGCRVHRPAATSVRALVALAARSGRGPGGCGRGCRRSRIAKMALRRFAEVRADPPLSGRVSDPGGAGGIGPGKLADSPDRAGPRPEEIELVQAVQFDTATDAGWADYYLFRFRTDAPHWAARYDWLAGVAGPFLRKDQPTIQAQGDTFSAFTPWDRKSIAEHLDDVRELMKTWRERHVAQEE